MQVLSTQLLKRIFVIIFFISRIVERREDSINFVEHPKQVLFLC